MITLIRLYRKLSKSFCPLMLISILLASWGCLAIYNASLQFQHPQYYAIRQITWLLFGIAITLSLHRLNGKFLIKTVPVLYLLGGLLLVVVLIAGHSHNHMRGWFHTSWFSLQPSEFCKPIYCLSLCWFSNKFLKLENKPLKNSLIFCLFAAPFIILVAIQPDFGTTLVYGCVALLVYFIYGGKLKHFFVSLSVLIPAILFIIYKFPYVKQRFAAFWNPEAHSNGAGFHLLQLERSIANGGFWGQSLGEGLWSQGYLPLTHNDSIFASFCEAVGFVGGFVIIAIFTVALFAANRKREKMHNSLYANMFFILVACLTIQAFIHISVNVQLIPPTGLTLPFFSYGGSSLVASFLIIGLCKSILEADKTEKLLLYGKESSKVQPFENNFHASESGEFQELQISGKTAGN